MQAESIQQDADITSFWVSPLQPIPAQTISLPPGDQVGVNIMTPCQLCFRTSPPFNEGRFIEAVQKAAAGVITEYPAMAGKVVFEDDSRKRIKCVIPPDAKVQVRIRRHADLNIDELEARHWAPHIIHRRKMSPLENPTAGIGSLNFAVQANLFRGGFTILMTLNHILVDGFSMGTLQEVFAHHLSAALDGKAPTLSGLLPPEALDKSSVHGTPNAWSLLEWKDWRKAPEVSLSPEKALAAMAERLSKLTLSTWYISAEKQAQLRAQFQQPGKKISLHMCFTIWLWRVITRARGLGPNTVSRNFTTTQTRGRVPGVHPNYCGNALVYGRSKVTAAELENMSPFVIGERINKSVAWWTPERIRAQWGSIEDYLKRSPITTVQPNMDRDFGTDVEISSTVNTRFYKVHWGPGVEPRAYRMTDNAWVDGFVIMHARDKDGGFEFTIFSEKTTLGKMVRDPKFRELLEYRAAGDPAFDEVVAKVSVEKARL